MRTTNEESRSRPSRLSDRAGRRRRTIAPVDGDAAVPRGEVGQRGIRISVDEAGDKARERKILDRIHRDAARRQPRAADINRGGRRYLTAAKIGDGGMNPEATVGAISVGPANDECGADSSRLSYHA